MNKEEQEHFLNILIENELYPLLECARDDMQREEFLEEYCKENEIAIQFARNKIARIKQQKAKAMQEIEEQDER